MEEKTEKVSAIEPNEADNSNPIAQKKSYREVNDQILRVREDVARIAAIDTSTDPDLMSLEEGMPEGEALTTLTPEEEAAKEQQKEKIRRNHEITQRYRRNRDNPENNE